jgi:thymidylate synthase (FAD)
MTNKVELIGYYGGDLTHALSAWTSTSRELTPEKVARIPSLLKFLADNGHETPFEKSTLHFLLTVDQATHIHLLKHRIGVSINAESARYKELKEDRWIVPEDWPAFWQDRLQEHARHGVWLYRKAVEELTQTLGRKRAKETARYFRTMNTQITMDVTFNFRSFVHFLRLRRTDHAQREICSLADEMVRQVADIHDGHFQHSLAAFGL